MAPEHFHEDLMARHPFAATEQQREKVRSLSAVGIPQDDIARLLGCTGKTLRKHFRHELDFAALEANAAVAGYLFRAARDGNVTAMIFWMKTRARWKETTGIELTGENGGPVNVASARERIMSRIGRYADESVLGEGSSAGCEPETGAAP